MLFAGRSPAATFALLKGWLARSFCDFNISWLMSSAVSRPLILSCPVGMPSNPITGSQRSSHPASLFTSSGCHSSSGWSCGGAHSMCLLAYFITSRCRYWMPVMNFIRSFPRCSLRYFISTSPSLVERLPPLWVNIFPSCRVIMLHLIAISSGAIS